ncbi:MAG: methylmalonyl Co-A mutase-associated GTPase MeaB, partial [Ignavibacteriae bacterium]
MTVKELVKKIILNDRRSVARAITIVEENNSTASELLMQIHSNVGNAYHIGIT